MAGRQAIANTRIEDFRIVYPSAIGRWSCGLVPKSFLVSGFFVKQGFSECGGGILQQCPEALLRGELLTPSENIGLRNSNALKQSFAPKPALYCELVAPRDHRQMKISRHLRGPVIHSEDEARGPVRESHNSSVQP